MGGWRALWIGDWWPEGLVNGEVCSFCHFTEDQGLAAKSDEMFQLLR
jgi:hypothetical protein